MKHSAAIRRSLSKDLGGLARAVPASIAVSTSIAVTAALAGDVWAAAVDGPVGSERHQVLETAAVSLSQAMEKAQTDYNGFAIEGALQEKDGMFYYQIDVITEEGGTEVYINPANGVVIGADIGRRYNMFSLPRDNSVMVALADAQISFKEAVSIAVTHFAGFAFDIRLEEKLGRYVYEIGLFNGDTESELEIAIDSGEVVHSDGSGAP